MQEWRKWIFFLLIEVAITRLMTTSTTTRKITARSYHQKQEPTTSAARIMRNEVMSDGQIIKPNFSVSLSKMDEWVGGWVWKKPHESFYPISMGNVLMHRRLDWCVDNSSLSLPRRWWTRRRAQYPGADISNISSREKLNQWFVHVWWICSPSESLGLIWWCFPQMWRFPSLTFPFRTVD